MHSLGITVLCHKEAKSSVLKKDTYRVRVQSNTHVAQTLDFLLAPHISAMSLRMTLPVVPTKSLPCASQTWFWKEVGGGGLMGMQAQGGVVAGVLPLGGCWVATI